MKKNKMNYKVIIVNITVYRCIIIGFLLVAIGSIWGIIEYRKIDYVNDFYGDRYPVITVDADSSIDLTTWKPSGEMAIYYTDNGVKQLLTCNEISINIAHHVDKLGVEKYHRLWGSDETIILISEYYEQLDNGVCIEVEKWFLPCTEADLKTYDNVKITVCITGLKERNIDLEHIIEVR